MAAYMNGTGARAKAPLAASLMRTAVVVGALTATVKIASLLKDTLVAQYFGNGAALDAFLLALVVPSFLISVAAGTLPSALTPVYISVRERDGARAAHDLAKAVLASTYRWIGLLSVFAALFSLGYGLLPRTALANDTVRALPWLALALAPYTFLQGACAAWSGMLAAEGEFRVSVLAPIAQPLVMAAALWLLGSSGSPAILAGGLLGGTVVQGVLLERALAKRGIAVLVWRIPTFVDRQALMRVRQQYAPAVASTMLMSATTLIDQSMATALPSGSVSALGYAAKLSALVVGVGSMALSTTLLPALSLHVARREWRQLRGVERRVASIVVGITLPLTVALIWFSVPIVRLLFERGAFTATESTSVAAIQSAYLLQIPVHLLGIVYVRLASALEANRLLTVGSAVNLVANIVLNVVFMRWYGAKGIALSTACVYAVSCGYLVWAARRQLALREREVVNIPSPEHRPVEVPCASAA
ncbi:MAG: polysaccharide biosynthesis C-terminal domain-containing protein [Gemmatimonadaceae bacterium]|nr:polysaccharide biosynthesis C-terminal domain-containing protein [Gemmatimonadaceae bacterium]